jgi:hypothetical protein
MSLELNQMKSPDGERLTRQLEKLLVALEPDDAAVTELYASLWDIHDGAVDVAKCIEELSGLDATQDAERITRLLFQIQFQLYGHLEKHLESMREPLENLCSRLTEEVEHA